MAEATSFKVSILRAVVEVRTRSYGRSELTWPVRIIFKLLGDVRANSWATLLPMPDEAPVTTMVFPSRRLPIAEAMLRWKVVLITFAIGVVLLLLLRRRADENEENVRKEVERGSMRNSLSMQKQHGNQADQDFSVITINDGICRCRSLKFDTVPTSLSKLSKPSPWQNIPALYGCPDFPTSLRNRIIFNYARCIHRGPYFRWKKLYMSARVVPIRRQQLMKSKRAFDAFFVNVALQVFKPDVVLSGSSILLRMV
jgi:hypothetical protein